jgi:Cu-Zn family superoxide dismutase
MQAKGKIMNTTSKRRVAAAIVVAAGSLGTGVALAGGGSARSSGPDYTYAGSDAFADATASVHVVHTGNGGTHVTLHVRNIDAPAGTTFGAHVHQHPCGSTGAAAGPHYQDADVTPVLEDREVWLDITVNDGGNGHAESVRPWSLDESSPRSVIIHALPTATNGTAGARLVCIDLDGDH